MTPSSRGGAVDQRPVRRLGVGASASATVHQPADLGYLRAVDDLIDSLGAMQHTDGSLGVRADEEVR